VRTDLLKKLTTLEAEEDSTSEFIGGVSERLATERERFRKRVVEVYRITRRNSVVRYLATAQSVTDLLRRTHYLRAMAERDRQVLMQLYTLATDLAAENQRLAAVRAERLAAVEQTKGLERQIEEQQKQKLSLLKTIEERTRQEGRALESLRQNASELETMLAGLMGGESVPSEPALASGEGLLPLRGRLSFPVSGKLVQGYGKHGHGEFSETVFVKGLEVAGVEGGKVKAVAAGRVAFSQQFPMLGHVVIVDHGERYYSLYGRLIGAFCSVGQVVKGGEEIGVLGALDKRGRNFYFEVRLRGKAVDPAPFFASLPRS
jgi:septal ring factor EnvC (AmiA/AmiB activator)